MSLLSGTIQPPLLSLFSSTSQPPLTTFFTHLSPLHPKESFITFLPDSSTPSRSKYHHVPRHPTPGTLSDPVIHIQSPTLHETYIQSGTSKTSFTQFNSQNHTSQFKKSSSVRKQPTRNRVKPLGIELPFITFQFRPLGKRHVCFEIGLVDTKGLEGVVRISSFQKDPKVYSERRIPMIQLPLKLPVGGRTMLTPWTEMVLDLNLLLGLFQTLPRTNSSIEAGNGMERHTKRMKVGNEERYTKRQVADIEEEDEEDEQEEEEDDDDEESGLGGMRTSKEETQLPSGKLASVSYVRVYANCRLRRIWFVSCLPGSSISALPLLLPRLPRFHIPTSRYFTVYHPPHCIGFGQ
ncbi:hypothetical protein M231_06829 [Tremella mesenterica]|uniref:CFA20 domain-containing protein n=1 Tax=Tremella mesenterica TaxID=5217 RepID=A0A4Q1BAU4_TREME|nr:hypothetical protein M231_06829 [Tremella mesenterica]